MKKILFSVTSLVLAFILLIMPVLAIEGVDISRSSSLTLQYRHNGKLFDGLLIKTFRVADISEDGVYTLTGDFKDYPVNIQGITSQTEWKRIATTLAAYAAADSIAPSAVKVTDSLGTVCFDSLLPGMYLTLSVVTERDGYITTFETFLLSVPNPDENGEPQYDVLAYPKCDHRPASKNTIEHKVVKQWRDNGHEELRPKQILVDIIRDGVLSSTQILSAENNWSYSWEAPDDGSIWQAVERNIEEIYDVTIDENGTTIIITNIYDTPETPPPTGDTASIWPYVLVMCAIGILSIGASVRMKRSDDE